MCADPLQQQQQQFLFVTIVSSIALVCMCGFLLYATIAEDVNSIAAVVFVIVAEITPFTLLIFTVWPKVTHIIYS